MQKKTNRYYLAISVGQFITEGHTKAEACKEFDRKRGSIDRLIESLRYDDYKLYLKTKLQLNDNRRKPQK